MTDATVEANPLRGHIVGFPKAIPSRDWLAQRMLWADQLGAVWPIETPTDRSDEERQALEDAHMYRAAGFFTPCSVPDAASPDVLKQVKASLRLPDSVAGRWLRSWATSAIDRWHPDATADDGPVDENQYFYVNKFPREVQRALLESGVAKREGGWLTIRTVKQAEALMTALAEHAKPWKELNLARILETKSPAALARAAAPTSASNSRPAVILDIPVVEGVTDNVRAGDVIEFRQKPGTEQARQDYLDAVGRFITKITTTNPSRSAESVARDKVTRDIQLASQSWVRRAASAGMGGVVLSTVSTVAPLPHHGTVGEWVGLSAGVAGIGVSLLTAVRKSHVHGYLNAAHRAGVLG